MTIRFAELAAELKSSEPLPPADDPEPGRTKEPNPNLIRGDDIHRMSVAMAQAAAITASLCRRPTFRTIMPSAGSRVQLVVAVGFSPAR